MSIVDEKVNSEELVEVDRFGNTKDIEEVEIEEEGSKGRLINVINGIIIDSIK